MNRMICYTNKLAFLVLILLTSGTAQAVKVWQPLGPSPIYGGQSEIDVNNPAKKSPQVGAINSIAPHPTNANILYVATVAGGIWKTENAKDAEPKWLPISDLGAFGLAQESLSTSDISFDLADTTYSTLVVSYGRYSSYGNKGGKRMGVIRSTDKGATWTKVSGSSGLIMDGKNINSVKIFSNVILASVDADDTNTCNQLGIFGSYDTGANWFQMGTSVGMIQGRAYALEADPVNNGTYYVGIDKIDCGGAQSGIYKTIDFGQSWTLMNNSTISAWVNNPQCIVNNQYLIAVGRHNNVYLGIICASSFTVGAAVVKIIFRSGDGGSNWTEFAIPGTNENSGYIGLHPGGQGFLHRSIVADPTDANIVYVGGDRQPDALQMDGTGTQFPNSIGAMTYSGRLFRGDASITSGTEWSPLTHSGTASNTAPHADSRDLMFDADGALIEVDDGGVYRMLAPRTNTSDWISANGNIQNSEIHSSDYDSNTNTSLAGLQDNGTSSQAFLAEKKWNLVLGGDGGDVAVGAKSLANLNQSIRYTSFQELGAFNRETFNQNNQSLSRIFFTPAVVFGDPDDFVAQFLTPIALNNVNPMRMIIGAENSVYESYDQGDTISEIGTGIRVARQGTKNIAYGNTQNEAVLYIGTSNGVYVRTQAGASLTFKFAAVVNSIVISDYNAAEAFFVEDAKVMHTTNFGINWTDITGNIVASSGLSDIGKMHSIEFVDVAGQFDGIYVGTDKGVFTAYSGNYLSWAPLGTLFPPVPVYSLEYNKEADVLIAGTMGRGEYLLKSPYYLNDAPYANPFDLSMNLTLAGTSSNLSNGSASLLDNFSDDGSQTLMVQTTPIKQPLSGILTLNANGSFSYQHDGSMTDSDEFYYRVCDNGNPILCNDAKVNITIEPGTGGLTCSMPNLDIPDNNPTGLTNTLTMMQSGLISDLDVSLEINHTYVADLTIKLVHVSTGTEVFLIYGGNGCSLDDISVVLDDAESLSVDDQCATPVAITGRFKPSGTLSSFNGLELAGNWNLNVTDSANQDTGALISWCLDADVGAANDAIFSSGFEL